MTKNGDIFRLAIRLREQLEYARNKNDSYSMIIHRTCNKKWNDDVCSIIDSLNDIYMSDFEFLDKKIICIFKNIFKIYRENYHRSDKFETPMDPSLPGGDIPDRYPIYWDLEKIMSRFVIDTLKELDILMDILHENEEQDNEIKELCYIVKNKIFENDITLTINMIYDEILKDYKNKCYYSSIILCGKLLETIISSLYIKIFDIDPDAEKLGFDAMINKLKKQGYDFSATKKHMAVIATHRNKAVHGSIIVPTKDEARGVIYLTKDILIKAESKKICDAQ